MKQGWEIKKLDELCQIELGKTPYRADKSFWDTEKKTDNVWLSIADLLNTNGDVVSDSKEYITDKAANISKVVKKGTLLLSFKLTLGRLAFAGRNLYTNEAIAALTIKDEMIIDKYFLYQFLSLFDWNAATEGDVKVKGKTLNKAKLKEIEVHFPKSLPEQQRIVSILDEAFAAIAKAKANAEQNLKNAKELFESYLQGVFEKNEKYYETKSIGEVCEIIDSLHKTPKYIEEGGFPMVRVTEIKRGNLDITRALRVDEETFKEFSKKHIPKIGDIVFSRVGASFGVSSIVTSNEPFCLGQNTAFIIPKLDSLYCYYFLNSQVARNQMNKLVAGAAQPTISLKSIKELNIPIPPLQEQQAIVRQLNALRAETQKLEAIYQKKLNDLEELKKSILQKAFAGELTSSASASASVAKVIPLQKVEGISPTDLQAGITAIALQKHSELNKQDAFGHVKAEKIVHLAEYILNIDLERNPVKDAAGPNDFPHAKKVESRAAKAGFYTVTKRASDQETGYIYTQGSAINSLIQKTQNCLGERNEMLSQLLKLIVPMKKQQAEIVATVYAAWNNLILKGNEFNDEDIVTEARENWREEKFLIPREKFFNAIEWIRKNELLIPKGNGKIVKAK